VSGIAVALGVAAVAATAEAVVRALLRRDRRHEAEQHIPGPTIFVDALFVDDVLRADPRVAVVEHVSKGGRRGR
jgi:hypothetical protein